MLREKLKLRIREDKNISFSEYMEIILFDKDYGLYEKDPVLGKEGHFITSPLVSKHFSHCIAKNFIRVSNDEKINYILKKPMNMRRYLVIVYIQFGLLSQLMIIIQ